MTDCIFYFLLPLQVPEVPGFPSPNTGVATGPWTAQHTPVFRHTRAWHGWSGLYPSHAENLKTPHTLMQTSRINLILLQLNQKWKSAHYQLISVLKSSIMIYITIIMTDKIWKRHGLGGNPWVEKKRFLVLCDYLKTIIIIITIKQVSYNFGIIILRKGCSHKWKKAVLQYFIF